MAYYSIQNPFESRNSYLGSWSFNYRLNVERISWDHWGNTFSSSSAWRLYGLKINMLQSCFHIRCGLSELSKFVSMGVTHVLKCTRRFFPNGVQVGWWIRDLCVYRDYPDTTISSILSTHSCLVNRILIWTLPEQLDYFVCPHRYKSFSFVCLFILKLRERTPGRYESQTNSDKTLALQ